jgi:MFS transporter, SP family, sugar:H+ symporter
MCVCQFIVAIVCIYIAFFACTWGPTPWTVSGEVFPLSIRAKGVALSTASNWLWNFVISFATPYIVDTDKGNLGVKVFFIWGSTCGLSLLFAYYCVYETKGLSLEQIDTMFKETTARKSSKWGPASQPDENRDVEMAQSQPAATSQYPTVSKLVSLPQAEKEKTGFKERTSSGTSSSS